MLLLDDVATKIKELRDIGIALSFVRCAKGDESVELNIAQLETRNIDEQTRVTPEEVDLDLYHET